MHEKLAEIEIRIKIKCNYEEQQPLLYGIAVAKYTSEYWSENLSNWIELAGLNTRYSWSWKDFGGSDIEGAVAGGVTGGMVGALAGGAGKTLAVQTLKEQSQAE